MTDRFEPWLVAAALAAACAQLAPGSDLGAEEAPDEAGDPAGESAPRSADLGGVDGVAPSAGAEWACLDQPATARAVPRRPGVSLTLAVTDIASRQPPEGLQARACSRLDVRCEAPLASVTEESSGGMYLTLPQGFDGFIELTSASSVPALYFLSRPLEADGHESLFVVSPSALHALGETAGVVLDEASGHLLSRAFDCDGAPAEGVGIEGIQGGVPFSFEGGLPRFGSDVTSSDGLVGYVNVPPGLLFMVGRELSLGRECGATSVLARGGWLTYGDIAPPER